MHYFRYLGWEPWNASKNQDGEFTYIQQHCGMWIDKAIETKRDFLTSRKVVVTVQHPHRCWVSFLTRNKTFDSNVYCWKSLLDWLPRIDYTIFDINCPSFEREEQCYNMLRHVEKYDDEHIEKTERFLQNEWKPLYAQDSDYKHKYLKQGILPEGYDYDKLNFAVEWYESLPSNSY